MPYPKKGKKGPKGTPSRPVAAQPSVTLKNNAPICKVPLRVQITESQVTPYNVVWFSFDDYIKNHPALADFTSVKVIRCGICIPPLTYLEFIVREVALLNINTRYELTTQMDCQFHHAVTPGLKTYWYKPGEAKYRGWQDITDTVATGLNFALCGKNQLDPSTSVGILCYASIEVQLKGMNTSKTTTLSLPMGLAPLAEEE